MKKSTVFVLVSAALVLSLIGFASAQTDIVNDISGFVEEVLKAIAPLLQFIVGSVGTSNTDDIFLAKVVIFVLLMAIVYSIASTMGLFGGKRWILWIISLAIPVLGVRFLTPEMVQTVILSNQTTAVALTALIPFAVYFYFVEVGMKAPGFTTFARKTAWILFAVVFTGLYFARKVEIGKFGLYVYGGVVVLSIVIALLDGSIQGWFVRARTASHAVSYKKQGAIHIQKKIADIQVIYNSNPAAYAPDVHSTASRGKKIGTDAYLADLAYFESELQKLLTT